MNPSAISRAAVRHSRRSDTADTHRNHSRSEGTCTYLPGKLARIRGHDATTLIGATPSAR
jgi:hypothetical protein